MPDVNKNKVYSLGSWRTVTNQFVKVNGTWQAVTNVYVKVDGVWKTSFPYPLSSDTTVQAIIYAGQQIANGGTASYPNTSGATVQVRVIPTNSGATVSGGPTSWTSSNGVWETYPTVSYANNPNTLSFTVTAENGVSSANYTVYLNVAAPSQITIYWAYCSGYNPPVTGSQTVSGTTDPAVACANKRAELGNPSNWVCQGTSAPTAPNCGEPPPTPCCTGSYVTYDGRIGNTCYYTTYYTDPCAGTTCSPVTSTLVVPQNAGCPEP